MNSEQPTPDAAVLGGQSSPLNYGAVLGGINGVKHRLVNGSEEVKIAALSDALDYGEEGLELILQALRNETKRVQLTAWDLLLSTANDALKLSLKKHSPWRSDVGVDYTRLRDLLSAGNWKEADQETSQILCKLAGRDHRGYLDTYDYGKFPDTDLSTINQLWLHYSNGRFGFSVQRQIWMECGGQPGAYDWSVYERLGDRVGWRRGGEWLHRAEGDSRDVELTFNISAPIGHLPYTQPLGFVGKGTWRIVICFLLSHRGNCLL